jgi:hypothetical protein
VAVADSADAGLPLSDPLKLALAAIDAGWHSLVPDEDAVCHLAEALLRIPEDLLAFPSAKYAGRRGLQPPHLCNPAPHHRARPTHPRRRPRGRTIARPH